MIASDLVVVIVGLKFPLRLVDLLEVAGLLEHTYQDCIFGLEVAACQMEL
jgi:hypothetical protein